ncbi:MAG TPA: carbohydrate ABC transporter permease [Paenibacillus sp.]|nr:carbohydrate ABC transporter permease [Paenibacillus sp.]
MRMHPSRRAFVIFNYTFLTLLSMAMLLPFLHILAGSFSSGPAITQGRVGIVPVEFTFGNFQQVLGDPKIWRSFWVTIGITVVGTTVNLALTSLMSYGLSKHDLRGRSAIVLLVLFTMIFPAPMIPSYLLVKELGLLNSVWSLIVPGAISAFNMIIMISFFRGIPEGLTESARIDGAGEYYTFWKIVLPLSLPSLSTIGLFYAVGHWNSYAQALMYIRNQELFPLQVLLRRLLVDSDEQMLIRVDTAVQSVEGIKMASIMVATIPILLVYPFIQKHFVKGAMLGSIKG